MKALILAAGRGSRLGEHPDEGNKCMLRLFGKPLVQYSLENAVGAGAKEVVMVVGHRAEAIINAFGIEFQGVRIRYVIQDEPRGLVHAIETAAEGLGLMVMGAEHIADAPPDAPPPAGATAAVV